MDERLLWFLGFLVLLTLGTFFLILSVFGWISGWDQLAQAYRCREPFIGRRWRLRDIQFGSWCNYSGCITVGASAAGLYLAMLFRIGHPPLLIPWSDLQLNWLEENFLGFRYRSAELTASQAPEVSFRLSEKLMTSIGNELGGLSVLAKVAEPVLDQAE